MPPSDCPGMKLGLRNDPWVSKNGHAGCVLFISLSACTSRTPILHPFPFLLLFSFSFFLLSSL